MAVVAFDHPFLAGLVGDAQVAAHLGAEADIRAMLAFEAALARAEASFGFVPQDAAARIDAVCAAFRPDLPMLREATRRDGVPIPELVRQLRQAAGDDGQYVHLGATSQDAIDTSLMLRLKAILALFEDRLRRIDDGLAALDERYGARILTGHTRMQAAIPITAGDRIATWRAPLQRHRSRLQDAAATALAVQFGGAAGTLEKLGDKGPGVRAALADALGLADAAQWHSQRDRLVELANDLSLVSGSLGKFGQDIALLAQAGGELSLTGGGGSSAMPHKQNPVPAEVLVTLARFNAVQISGLHHAMVHEQERSGAAWTLEWLVLPQIILATGAALRHAAGLIDGIRGIGRA
ncbi:3-carboxy-cis,cis-muconate cycloisomerase [Pseudochelatococcus sp. B33]